MRHLLAPLALVFIFVISMSPAQAGRNGRHGGKVGNGHRMQGMFKDLNLSEEQRAQMGELRKKKIESMKPLRQQSKQARANFFEKLKGNASEDELRKAHTELAEIKSKKAAARFENMLAVRRILSPEQRQQLQSKFEKGGHGHNWHKEEREDYDEQ